MSGLMAETIRSAQGLAALEPAWWALWRRSPDAAPFLSPAWLLPWWEAFAPGRLATIAVWRGADLVGLAPLYVEDGPEGGRRLPVGVSLSDQLDVLADPAERGAVLAALADAAAQRPEPLLWLELAPGACAWDAPVPPGWREERGEGEACPVLSLAGACGDGGRDADGTPLAVPARKRRKLRMASHRAERRGAVRIETAEDVGCAPFLAELERLHGARWTSRGEAGVLADEAVRAFHRRALPRLMAAGLAETALLRIGGVAAGAYYGLRDQRRSYAYIGGFDPDFARESPGAILLGRAIAAAADRGAEAFSFLRGREDYKYDWGAADRLNGWRRLSPERPDG
ncbi:GNAT family N-acetyltransferase [Alsobacter sp. SYSU BS001988]